jgi:WD repeat-containing protein 68
MTIDTPVLAYDEELEVNNATWRGDQGDWIGVVSGKGFQAVQL